MVSIPDRRDVLFECFIGRTPGVVHTLVPDVRKKPRKRRRFDGARPVACLPAKWARDRLDVPRVRGTSLQQLDRRCERDAGMQLQHDMNVVVRVPDPESLGTTLERLPAKASVQPLIELPQK